MDTIQHCTIVKLLRVTLNVEYHVHRERYERTLYA